MLFLLKYESVNYLGAGEYAVVSARTKHQAQDLADKYMESLFHDNEVDRYTEEYGEPNGQDTWATMVYCVELTPQDASWKFVTAKDRVYDYAFIGISQEELQQYTP
jgi:hypothetical protein